MSVIAKSLIGLGTLGTIGGVGAYAGGLFESKKDEPNPKITKTTYKDKLKSEGFQVLDTTKDTDWQEVFTVYNATGTTKNLFSRPKSEIKSFKELQEECAKILDTDSQTDTNYSLARQWCVKKEKMNAVINRAKLKLLKFDAQEHADEKPHWVNKLRELKKNKQRFSAIASAIKEGETTQIETENISELKKGCTNLNTTTLETTSEDFAKNLELAKEWCSIDK